MDRWGENETDFGKWNPNDPNVGMCAKIKIIPHIACRRHGLGKVEDLNRPYFRETFPITITLKRHIRKKIYRKLKIRIS